MPKYLITIIDPEEPEKVYHYVDQSFTPKAAEIAAKHAFTGLLGGPSLQEIRDRLEVKVEVLDE